MNAILFSLLPFFFMLSVVIYDKKRRSLWEPIGNGFWVQRITNKSNAQFTFRTSGNRNATSMVPALWEIKHPFSNGPEYVTEHEEQLKQWWEPLAQQFAALSTIKAIKFAPTLGIYVQVQSSKKTNVIPEEEWILRLLDEAVKTWKPRRFDMDNTYATRKMLLQQWIWFAAIPSIFVVYTMFQCRYIDFLGDFYYIKVATPMLFVVTAFLVYWLYPKMEGSVHRVKALAQIAIFTAVVLAATLPCVLIWSNMAATTTICRLPVPVTNWFSTSGKSTTYYAELDLRQCSTAVPPNAAIKVQPNAYQNSSKINIRVSKGSLGRYFLQTE